jgi:hypothetical protein
MRIILIGNPRALVAEATLWRRTTHFAHWISTNSSEEHNQNNQKRIYSWLHKSYYASSPVAWSTVKHSCVPTLLMVMNDLGGKTVSSKGDDKSKNNVLWLTLYASQMEKQLFQR